MPNLDEAIREEAIKAAAELVMDDMRVLEGNDVYSSVVDRSASRADVTATLRTLVERAQSQWRGIESAPKDGTRYLGWGRGWGFMVVNEPPGHWPGDWSRDGARWAGQATVGARNLTHWLPLPSAPQEEKEG